MTKAKTIKLINEKMDFMILNNDTDNPEYKRLMKLHYEITHN